MLGFIIAASKGCPANKRPKARVVPQLGHGNLYMSLDGHTVR